MTTNQQEIIKEQVRFYRYRKTVDFHEPSAQAFLDGDDELMLNVLRCHETY